MSNFRSYLAALEQQRLRRDQYKIGEDHKARVNVLGDVCGLRLEELLDHLGVKLKRKGKMLSGPCPVHGGDGNDALNMYPDGHTTKGNWKCRSRACHLEFKKQKTGSGTLIGFVWGVLSHQRLNWQKPGDARVSFSDVTKLLCDFVGTPLKEIEVDLVEAEKVKFTMQMETLARSSEMKAKGWPRDKIRSKMDCPAEYYLKRGYREDTLDRYDVGLWRPGENSILSGRVAVPVFDDEGDRVIGVTARSLFEKCEECKQHHDPALSCVKDRGKQGAKWLNNEGFRKEAYLYNYWNARHAVAQTKVIAFVEGPGDVWRLVEGGVVNAVALFGNELNDPQQVILERSGAMNVVLFPHNDEAGQRSRDQIKRELGSGWNLHFYHLKTKDVGEMTADQVRAEILPFLNSLAAKD